MFKNFVKIIFLLQTLHLISITTIKLKRDVEYVSQFTIAEQNEISQIHNNLRSLLAIGNLSLPGASNMQTMFYDTNLEHLVYNHTKKCIFELSNVKEYGENMFRTNSSESLYATVVIALNIWWDQIKVVKSNVFDPSTPSLNFAQMAWANTTKIGCSSYDCESFKIISCYYYPRGNIDNEVIYKNGQYCKNDGDCVSVNNGTCEIGKGLCKAKNLLDSDNTIENENVDELSTEAPENMISLENITGNIGSTLTNGLGNVGSFLQNTTGNLLTSIGNTANNILNKTSNIIETTGQTLSNATTSLLNSTGVNVNSSFLGNIPGVINGAASMLSNATGHAGETINNFTNSIGNTINGIGQNVTTPNNISEAGNFIINGTSNLTNSLILNGLNGTTNIAQDLFNLSNGTITNMTNGIDELFNGTISNTSQIIPPVGNGTLGLVNNTQNLTPNISMTTLPTTLNSSQIINNTTNNILNSTAISSNETTTINPIETTTCQWNMICNTNTTVPNQILSHFTSKAPNVNGTNVSSGNGTCVDLRDHCETMELFCSFSMYNTFMFSTCPKTCKQC
uniref:SCP domain-containing protein n=1 Tax=Parastrongyloides trichosuri TaxID=131310 RepID=A0A0N4ZHF5_PARTI